jgi:hypothetical protein
MCVNSVNTEYRLVYPRPGLVHRRNQARSSSCPLAAVGWLEVGWQPQLSPRPCGLRPRKVGVEETHAAVGSASGCASALAVIRPMRGRRAVHRRNPQPVRRGPADM